MSYPSCGNLTDGADLKICDPNRNNDTDLDQPLFDEDLERIVSLTVFVLFGFIFVAGLIGNALVVIGEHPSSLLSLLKRDYRFLYFLNPWHLS